MLYRTFFPEDVDISVPYVAPLCYGVEDGRHEPFLKMVSTPEARKKIEDFQLEVLKRKPTLLARFEKYCAGKKYKFRAPVEEIYDYSGARIFVFYLAMGNSGRSDSCRYRFG